MARFGERATPWVMWWERSLWGILVSSRQYWDELVPILDHLDKSVKYIINAHLSRKTTQWSRHESSPTPVLRRRCRGIALWPGSGTRCHLAAPAEPADTCLGKRVGGAAICAHQAFRGTHRGW